MFRYKLALKILAIFVFLAPVFWIVLDPAGQRWADVTLLRILGNPSINLDYAALTGEESVDDIAGIYPDLELQCDIQRQGGLDRVCLAEVASVNQLPARDIVFYFRDGRLFRLKLAYRAAYHEPLYQQLRKVYGKPMAKVDSSDLDQRVVQWRTGPGMVVMKAVVSKKGDNQLFWLTPNYKPAG